MKKITVRELMVGDSIFVHSSFMLVESLEVGTGYTEPTTIINGRYTFLTNSIVIIEER
jgi:hypothetical protein